MQLPQIRLHQTYAQIGMRTVQPVQEIQQIPAELSIKQYSAKMEIERKPSELHIDQEQAWNELGFKSPSVFSRDMADSAKQKGLENIGKMAEEGHQLAAIENKTNAIQAIASKNANPGPADFTIAFIPSFGSVKINYKPSELHIDWKPGGTEIEVEPHRPIHKYTPGKTEVYLRQREQLEIDFIGLNVNQKL